MHAKRHNLRLTTSLLSDGLHIRLPFDLSLHGENQSKAPLYLGLELDGGCFVTLGLIYAKHYYYYY